MTDTENTPPSADETIDTYADAVRKVRKRVAQLDRAVAEMLEARAAVAALPETIRLRENNGTTSYPSARDASSLGDHQIILTGRVSSEGEFREWYLSH